MGGLSPGNRRTFWETGAGSYFGGSNWSLVRDIGEFVAAAGLNPWFSTEGTYDDVGKHV